MALEPLGELYRVDSLDIGPYVVRMRIEWTQQVDWTRKAENVGRIFSTSWLFLLILKRSHVKQDKSLNRLSI